eukprot:m.6219 g.6219  ORF g.6219 m.6219 type:complete len:360 (-) comp2077_c0_seq1:573-1652(-)
MIQHENDTAGKASHSTAALAGRQAAGGKHTFTSRSAHVADRQIMAHMRKAGPDSEHCSENRKQIPVDGMSHHKTDTIPQIAGLQAEPAEEAAAHLVVGRLDELARAALDVRVRRSHVGLDVVEHRALVVDGHAEVAEDVVDLLHRGLDLLHALLALDNHVLVELQLRPHLLLLGLPPPVFLHHACALVLIIVLVVTATLVCGHVLTLRRHRLLLLLHRGLANGLELHQHALHALGQLILLDTMLRVTRCAELLDAVLNRLKGVQNGILQLVKLLLQVVAIASCAKRIHHLGHAHNICVDLVQAALDRLALVGKVLVGVALVAARLVSAHGSARRGRIAPSAVVLVEGHDGFLAVTRSRW